MINYNRLGYEIKRDFTNFSLKISKGLKRPQEKFVHQIIYGILSGNKVHLSEIARSLKEHITLKKTIERLSNNLNALGDKDLIMHNYLGLVKRQVKDDYAVIIIDNSDIAKPASRKLRRSPKYAMGAPVKSHKGTLPSKRLYCLKKERCRSQSMKRCFPQRKKDLSVKPTKTCAVCSAFLKISASDVSVLLTVVLIPMTITAIS